MSDSTQTDDGDVNALACGNFASVARDFVNAGFNVGFPGPGMLEITAANAEIRRARALLSVGIHGDETAPIEMLANILAGFAHGPEHLCVDLLIVVGNPAAIAQQRRYIDTDLNRLFRDDLPSGAAHESRRAHCIMRAVADFFSAPASQKIHLDLHTAIRASHHSSFGIVPEIVAETEKRPLVAWLGSAGMSAVVINGKPAGTFSAYTAMRCAATSATVELGRVGRLGENDQAQYSAAQAALEKWLRSGIFQANEARYPEVFDVAQEIIKRSDNFTMKLDRSAVNFTPLRQGEEIARDGDVVYRVNAQTEYILFPNPDVAIGQRAGLTVVQRPKISAS